MEKLFAPKALSMPIVFVLSNMITSKATTILTVETVTIIMIIIIILKLSLRRNACI